MSIGVKKLVVGQLETNCYLVFDSKTRKAIIIDPGDDADYIIRILSDLEVKPLKIVATHGHLDHILAVTELKLAYNIPFLIHRADEFLLKRVRPTTKHFLGTEADPTLPVDDYLKEGDKLAIDNCELKIITTPGHTPGSVSLYSKKAGIVFVGDLIFAGGGLGRTDFQYASFDDLKKSIEKILKLPKETIVYSGHGEETIIGNIVIRL
jgi:hydroxyacylglutathione hydrolase